MLVARMLCRFPRLPQNTNRTSLRVPQSQGTVETTTDSWGRGTHRVHSPRRRYLQGSRVRNQTLTKLEIESPETGRTGNSVSGRRAYWRPKQHQPEHHSVHPSDSNTDSHLIFPSDLWKGIICRYNVTQLSCTLFFHSLIIIF